MGSVVRGDLQNMETPVAAAVSRLEDASESVDIDITSVSSGSSFSREFAVLQEIADDDLRRRRREAEDKYWKEVYAEADKHWKAAEEELLRRRHAREQERLNLERVAVEGDFRIPNAVSFTILKCLIEL